jgi:uncharacterized protein YcbK (DUF882 family)
MISLKGPSTNLSWLELGCKDGTPYPEEYIMEGRAFQLALAFEDIRALCGNKPIIIYSAYRTPEWNKKVGGAKLSQHVEGRALDLHHTVMKNDEFYEAINKVAWELGIRGIGRYRNFVHIDIRPSDKMVAWSGAGKKESSV